ncbi:AraC family transcriptional regulator [Pseudodonghicola flavimaris]|uniref:Helix-turn-helix transcriptional regulator n=1 Tax=Pseudodonghicola flavimaris TaxID=3050036 RepID=A0ABT7F5H3_9RHOB|nr:helix-turn-helix transcriptional regulator [Pseudodonghicola flavimaris]MDK3019858.1 helix-turn-helix transcriptional regulator [Pseudodonghicola flavimaris]
MPKHVEYPSSPLREPTGDGFDLSPRRPVIARCGTLGSGFAVQPHAHPRAQLVLCLDGTLRLRAGEDVWMVPHKHAVWIPGGQRHQLSTQTALRVRHLYVAPQFAARAGLPQSCTVLRGSPLLRGIVERLAEVADPAAPAARRLAWVALDEIARLRPAALHLPGARDSRLAMAMAHFLRHPEERRNLAEVARDIGTSDRTLERLFVAETGMTFRDWRGKLRCMVALEGIERGETSTALAGRLGYSSPSAFIAAFRRQLGAPPSAFRKDAV